MVNKEFFLALEELVKTMKIDENQLIQSLEAGLASAYKKESGESRAVSVSLNPEKNTIKYFAYYTVVDEEITDDSQLSLEEAQDIKADAKVGDIIGEDVTPKNFSRIAAQTAKQVIIQRLNEAKHEQVMTEMTNKEGELMNAIVRRVESNAVYVEIVGSQLEGIMSVQEQVFGEKYAVNDKIKVYVKKVRTSMSGSTQVVVSRACAGFVRKLFEIEVPELRSGLVKIKNIVREAGYRTKMAVYSDDPNVDAIGSCIGAKGARVNAIVAELNGEKIDVIPYSADPMEYIARSLSPAKVLMVQLNEEAKQAKVIVPDDKLSLAIGKSGQNARLAARLTGLKIDVKPYSSITEEEGE